MTSRPGDEGEDARPDVDTRRASRMESGRRKRGRPRAAGLPEWPAYAPPRRATMVLADPPRLVDAPQEPERAVWDAFLG